MNPAPLCLRSRAERSAALVIVLAFIALLTGLVTAALLRSTAGTQLSASSLNASKADQLAISALNIVVGSLKQEIANGSTPYTHGSATVYQPTGITNMVPARFGNPAAATPLADPIPNLVRISSRADRAVAPPMVPSLASADASTNSSMNGRRIGLDQWNRHYLIPRATGIFGTKKSGTAPIASFTPPDWVLVTPKGPKVLAGPDDSVVGRYAFAIFDEGGLLDANVAGYPANGTAALAGRKGSAAFADLTQIGLTQPQIDLLAGWRNYATAQPGGSLKAGFTFPAAAALRFANAMATNSGGFTSVSTNVWNGRTDSAFVSRQALIGFFLTNGLPQDSLQYLATFTQGRNAPSWGPAYNAATLGGAAAFAYRDLANTDGQANRFLPNTPFPSKTTLTTYALDGSVSSRDVAAGSSVVQRRFSLARIAWLAYNGPNQSIAHPENVAKAIQHHFGLVWDATNFRWIYTSPDGNTAATAIKTLDLVAKQGREPDFFELLQAVILNGSLGKDAGAVGTTTTYGPSGDTQAYDQTRAYQILQIGANIIDQAQADSFPTDIHTDIGPMAGGTDVYGSVDLPQLARVFFCSARYASNDQRVGGWFVPEVWNPYQTIATGVSGPTIFRFVGTGSAYLQVSGTTAAPVTSTPTATLASQGYVAFNSGTVAAGEPTLLTPANATASTAANTVTLPTISDPNSTATPKYGVASTSLMGLWVGDAPQNCAYDPAVPATDRNFSTLVPQGANFFLQYSNSVTGGWSTYAVMKQQKNSIRAGNIVDIANPIGSAAKNFFAYVQRVDPRSDRFGGSMAYQSYGGWMGKPNVTIRPSWAQLNGETLGQWPPNPTSGFTYTSSSGGGSGAAPFHNWASLGMLGENRTTSSVGAAAGTYNVYYSDPDGVVRRADGAYAVRNQNYGLPMMTGNTASRPVMLHRPFRSVAELGVVFRDLPWKNLDLLTPESADAGLLDAFSVDDADVASGRVNLNTRQAPVLRALLSGAQIGELPPNTPNPIPTADVTALANALVTATSQTNLVNRADLVNRFTSTADSDARFATYPKLSFAAVANNAIASQRLSLARALADSSETRTWNLLIDIVAQTGRYPSTAKSLDQFLVDGQRHYWFHVSIDRITGQVVARSLEPVYE